MKDDLKNSATLPKVYLSHLALKVNEKTYADIEQSEFLQREFTWFEQRSTISDEGRGSWTGVYLYGENSYFEFLSPPEIGDMWLPGLAFGVDESGNCQIVHERLKKGLDTEVWYGLRTRKYNDEYVPWFYQTSIVRNPIPRLVTWVMEFHGDFLKVWHPELLPELEGMTRHQILERYCANVGRKTPQEERYFKDIYEVTVALGPEEADLLAQEVEIYGYKVRNKGQDLICEGPDFHLIVVPPDSQSGGIREFRMSLHRDKEGQKEYQFGDQAKLTFNGNRRAVWTFH